MRMGGSGGQRPAGVLELGLRKFCVRLRSHNALLITRSTVCSHLLRYYTNSLSLFLSLSLSLSPLSPLLPHVHVNGHHHRVLANTYPRRPPPTASKSFSLFFFFFFFFSFLFFPLHPQRQRLPPLPRA